MKKVLSLILALAMMLSMVTFAHADEPATEATDITITYWNANTNTVVLELSRKVESADALKAAMTISGFTADDFTVKEQTSPAGQYTEGRFSTNSESGKTYSFRKLVPNNTTYTVQLIAGKNFAFGTEYTLTVAESLFGSTTELKFTVNKIAVDTLATKGPWHASTASNLKFDEGVLALNKHRAKLNSSSTEVFGDTGFPITQWENNTTNNPARDRINMEVDVKVANTSVDHHVSIGFANRSHTWAIQSGSYSGFAGLGFGGNSAGLGTFSVFIAKSNADAAVTYPEGSTVGEYYAAQSHANVFGNMAYNGVSRAWPVSGTTSPFSTDAYKHMAYFYDAASATEDGRVTLGVEDMFYNYVHDMPVTNLKANPHFSTSGSKAYFKDLKISYPTGSIRTFKITTVPVEAPTSWTAASDSITLIFADDLDASALESAITLEDKDGVPVDATVTELTDVTKASVASGKHSYRIKLDNGRFDSGEPYKLTISSATDLIDDGDEFTFYKLAAEYVLNFKVDLVVIEGFDYEENAVASAGESDFAWVTATSSNRNGTMTIKKDADDNMYAEVKATGKTYFAPYADNDVEFANTEMDGRAYCFSDYTAMTEYTTEIELKVVSSADTKSAYDFRMDQTRLAHSTAYNQGEGMNESMLGMHVWKSTTPSYIMRPAGHSVEKSGNYLTYSQQSTGKSALWPAVGAEDYTRIIMSSEGNNFRFFIGDSITNIENYGYSTPPRKGIPALWFNSNNTSGSEVVYHIDNLILSQASEVVVTPVTTVESIAVTVDGEEIDTLAGMDTVDVEVAVSRTISAAPVKAVLAVYKANGEMANVVMSETTTLAVGTTTFEFAGVELNGGETINVFFWDSFDSLYPYTNPALFPVPVEAE